MDRQVTIDRFRSARSDPDLAVLEGFHPLKHALRFGAEVVEALSPRSERVVELADDLAPDVSERLRDLLTEIPADLYGELSPRPPDSGVVGLARRPATTAGAVLGHPAPRPVVLLEEPSHLGNLGAAVRAAAAAGAAGVLVTGEHDPWHASALRGSAGLHFALPVAPLDEPARRLADRTGRGGDGGPATGGGPRPGGAERPGRRPLVALDPDGEELAIGTLADRAVLAFGSERRGLSPAVLAAADRRVRIPMEADVSSLNLATSVAVVLYAWRFGTAVG